VGKTDFGDFGLASVDLVLPNGREVSLEDLRNNDHILNSEAPTVRVRLPDEEDADADKKKKGKKKRKGGGGKGLPGVTVEHRWNGRSLPEDAVREKNDGRYGLSLFRGRNEVVVTVAGQAEPFVFPIFYRTSLCEWVESLVKALVLVVIVKTFVVQAFFIPTGSMEDTLFPSDYILVEKVTGLFERPKTGDVIVFQYPEDPTKDFIKRKVADQGDVIEMRRKSYLVNGECLEEDFAVHKEPQLWPRGTMRDSWGPVEVPPAHSFAMGDNRDRSKDSRFWGPLPDYRLKGRALAIYYPFSRWGFIRPEVGAAGGECPEPFRDEAPEDLRFQPFSLPGFLGPQPPP
jgi:signal peptidase I